MVYTCRPDDVPASPTFHCLSNRGAAGAPITRLVLGPLDVAGTAEMVSSMLSGEQVSDEFAAFVHQRTEGLPLAIEESVRLMGDRRDLARRDGEWVRRRLDRIEVPPTIRDAVLERIQRQDAGTQRLLQAAAVLGTPADLRTLAAVAGLPIAEVRDGLNAALSCGLMREDARGQAGFRHVLDGQAVYEAIPPPKRRLLPKGGDRGGVCGTAVDSRGGESPPRVRRNGHLVRLRGAGGGHGDRFRRRDHRRRAAQGPGRPRAAAARTHGAPGGEGEVLRPSEIRSTFRT